MLEETQVNKTNKVSGHFHSNTEGSSGTYRHSSTTCQGCGESFSGQHWSRGHCLDCGAKLCFRCWGTKQHVCGQKLSNIDLSNPPESEANGWSKIGDSYSCAGCGRSMPRVSSGEPAELYCLTCQHNSSKLGNEIPTNAISLSDSVYRQLIFTRFIKESVRRIKIHPVNPEFKLEKTKVDLTETKNRSDDLSPTGDSFSVKIKERTRVLPKESEFSIVAMYKGRRKRLFRAKKAVRLRCFANTSQQELIETGYATPSDENALRDLLTQQEAAKGCEVVSLMFSPAGWKEDIIVPQNTVLVSLAEKGEWHFSHSVSSLDLSAYVQALFEVGSHEDKVEQCVQAVFKQPGVNFPLSARRLSEDEELPIHMVAEAFRRIAKKEHGLIVCDDQQKNDWLLDIR